MGPAPVEVLQDAPSTPIADVGAHRVVISQVYGGGGNSGATLKNDFIELYNNGPDEVSLDGWSVQYTSATGPTTGAPLWFSTPLSGSIAPGKYYLVQEAAGASGTTALPTPDATGDIAMGAGAGKVVLVKMSTARLSESCPTGASIVDLVGYGGANCFEGTGPTAATSNTTAALRKLAGAQDGNDNAADFTVGPPRPRNRGFSPAVASVTITPPTAAVAVGSDVTLAASALDASGQVVAGVAFTWESGAPTVATVSPTGVVRGMSVGTATITATTPSGIVGSRSVSVFVPHGEASNVRISEFHYDDNTSGGDADEMIEVEGDAGGSLDGWSLVLYNGNGGSSYATLGLSGTIPASTAADPTPCVGRGVITAAAPGLQNGSPDGIALVNANGQVVEFLSYEGPMTATNGPAAGMASTDVGVAESNNTPAGRSLQRAQDGTWYGPYTSTFGACNPATPPPPQTGITFTGRTPSDPPIPVGFQDQVFATLRDENTGATVPTTFTWSSETPAVATVDERGVVTPLAAGTAVIRATAANGITNTVSLPTEIAPLGDASLYGSALTFGVPSDDTPGDELRVTRAQYELSYNQARGTPNWVAYRLTNANRGNLPGYRCDCFAVDALVTSQGQTGLTTADYTGSGFDRGHMVRSNDRELARGDQAATYYMSNIVPQYGNMNQGRWADLESFLQTVVERADQPQVYIFAGPHGSLSTIAGGRITVPTHTWKVAVVLAAGKTPADVRQTSDVLELIAVDMPNLANLPRDGNWRAHLVTVDSVEKATGYDLLSVLPPIVEAVLESGDRAPTARIAGAGLAGGNEGAALAFDARASSDPDVGTPLADALSFEWSVDGTVVGAQPSLAHTFPNDGTYQLRLVVTDRFGLADTTSASVAVLNVAPSVGAFSGATILSGETYQATGAFADPGADSWSGSVSFGEGAPETLTLQGKSFALSHVYAVAGTFVVTVSVGDGAATGTGSATVVVQTPLDGVRNLMAMLSGGALAGAELTSASADATGVDGTLTSLRAKLNAAGAYLTAGSTADAIDVLGAFINEVDAMRRTRRMADAKAASLIEYAGRVIRSAQRSAAS